MSATIIAASIPFYRPFFRHLKSSGRSGGDNSSSSRNNGNNARSHASYALNNCKRVRDGHSMLDSGVDHKGAAEDVAHDDSNSDKAILGRGDTRIIRQTNISVNYMVDEEANYPRGLQQHRDEF